tara:strand:- start:156 stop:779 length:624 start_codon:yes stop_codon:yes gene_type:complete
MRIREITESRQQINEVAPLIWWAGWAAANVGYSAYQAYQSWQAWKRNEISDARFTTQIGAEAFNALANFFGGVAAFKAANIGLSALRRAWGAAGQAASGAATAATVAYGANQAAGTAEKIYPEYQKWQRGDYSDAEFKRMVGDAAFAIIKDMLLFYGLSKAVVIPWRLFRGKWTELVRAASGTAAAYGGTRAANAASDEFNNALDKP